MFGQSVWKRYVLLWVGFCWQHLLPTTLFGMDAINAEADHLTLWRR